MKYFIKNIHLILLLIILLPIKEVLGKDNDIKYSKEDISNYLSGIISMHQDHTTTGFKYLNKVQSLKKIHNNYNVQFVRSLVLLEKFEQAFTFSKSVWLENEQFFEADLLLGLQSFIKKDYLSAQRYFERLNKISQSNLFFEDFLGNILISWVKASNNNQKDSHNFLNKIPDRYYSLKQIQNSFLQCYFDSTETQATFENLILSEDLNFSRYNFFLINYLLFKKNHTAAEKIINLSEDAYNKSLLIKQASDFIQAGNSEKITNFFSCKNPRDVIAEIFYLISNLYSTEENYQLSNFYLKISLFLNKKFLSNRVLLAENFYNQKKYELSKKTYHSIKTIGQVYSWYSSRRLALILTDTTEKEQSVKYLKKEFDLLLHPNFEHYYDLANFFKDNVYYEESIKYYSLALKNLTEDHFLFPKILDRRGTSYERLGNWDKAEEDLIKSLEILPDQPHVLNYLAYSWVDKGINVDEAIKMLKKANKLRENDGYIIDSLGWAYYVNKNYVDAEKFLRKAVEILPLDPIINDHYGDALWMLKKSIQARYFWKSVLSLDKTEKKLKDKINKKLVFGVAQKL